MSYRHRVIADTDLVLIRRLIAENPLCSRQRLSEKLCVAWNWVQPNGALRDMVCRSIMLMLLRQRLIELPPVRQVGRSSLAGRAERAKPAAVSVDQTTLSMSFGELGPLEIRQVRRTPEEALFNGLVQHHHYLGYSQPMGEACCRTDGCWPMARRNPKTAPEGARGSRFSAGLSTPNGSQPASNDRFKRIGCRVLPCSGGHWDGKIAFENPILLVFRKGREGWKLTTLYAEQA